MRLSIAISSRVLQGSARGEVRADAIGIIGGYLVAVSYLGANPVVYVNNTFQFLAMDDLTSGLIKSAVFGFLLSLVGCQCGFDTKGGAEGVGRSTTTAVVMGSLTGRCKAVGIGKSKQYQRSASTVRCTRRAAAPDFLLHPRQR